MVSFFTSIQDLVFGILWNVLIGVVVVVVSSYIWRNCVRILSDSESEGNFTTNSIPSAASLAARDSLQGIEVKLIQQILNTIAVASDTSKSFDDIVSQESAKLALTEAVIKPALNPRLYTGNDTPAKGILFFGPPGNGKTLLAKAVANAVKNVTLFYITSSKLTSKYYGEPAKLVEALFAVAKECEPSIIFIDEMDSILQESDNENEATRTLRKQFQSSMDGFFSKKSDRIVVIGTTNEPEKLPQAVLRRFNQKIYVGPPNLHARLTLLKKLMSNDPNCLKEIDYAKIGIKTKLFTLSDVDELVHQACRKRVEKYTTKEIRDIKKEYLRQITFTDFEDALKNIRPTLKPSTVQAFEAWNNENGVIYKRTATAIESLDDNITSRILDRITLQQCFQLLTINKRFKEMVAHIKMKPPVKQFHLVSTEFLACLMEYHYKTNFPDNPTLENRLCKRLQVAARSLFQFFDDWTERDRLSRFINTFVSLPEYVVSVENMKLFRIREELLKCMDALLEKNSGSPSYKLILSALIKRIETSRKKKVRNIGESRFMMKKFIL